MKATGMGLELSLDSFRIDLGPPIRVDQDMFPGDYFFMEYPADDGYRYAVCSHNPDFEPRMRHISFHD